MTVQHILLPLVYAFWQAVFRKRVPGLIVFADAHHDTLPFSMQVMHEAVRQCRYTSIDFFHDYGRLSAIQALWVSVKFMKLYAQARYVFICDNFLPVSYTHLMFCDVIIHPNGAAAAMIIMIEAIDFELSMATAKNFLRSSSR